MFSLNNRLRSEGRFEVMFKINKRKDVSSLPLRVPRLPKLTAARGFPPTNLPTAHVVSGSRCPRPLVCLPPVFLSPNPSLAALCLPLKSRPSATAAAGEINNEVEA
uniref:Uncharacterized protein n=1 Tax=Cucumis sativus TaxID=3659 RepID=A0A0A0KSP9_CUCSA